MKHTKVKTSFGSPALVILSLVAGLMGFGSMAYAPAAEAAASCSRTVTADVVALDQPVMFNRLGAQNVNYMIYALKRDLVTANYGPGDATANGIPLTVPGTPAVAGKVALRPDKRPRPLVLRVAAGECLQVTLTNLLTDIANPFNGQAPHPNLINDNQVAGRWVSFHPLGLHLATSTDDDGSYVGTNANNLVPQGGNKTYTYYADAENTYMVYSRGQPLGGEASGGNIGVGLFGVVTVEPKSSSGLTRFYRSQLTEEEMRLASMDRDPASATCGEIKKTAHGQPVIDYEALYPSGDLNCSGGVVDLGGSVWADEGKAGAPILNILCNSAAAATGACVLNEIVHSDINAVIAGPNADGTFPADTYPLESVGKRNPAVHNRLEAFREFTVVFHDEQAAAQAFPLWFGDPVLGHTLHGVRDSFMINYGAGGIGAEIIANRLGVGPMHDCLNCAYEEFFLSAYTVGDPAMLVDVPANTGLEACAPDLTGCVAEALVPKATRAFFPEDPSNVHHSYQRDHVKFRNLHAGPKEQHIFHLHNHQWLFNPNDDNSNYIDAQGVGPGSGYTYEINFGGSGNRNISAGDAIFHCHFYPHFAQGMWELWRINDTTQTGTVLAVSGDGDAPGFHASAWGLKDGTPALVMRDIDGETVPVRSRALPDGEIAAGTPIPALVPLPGKAMAPMPGDSVVLAQDVDNNPLTGAGDPDVGMPGADRSVSRVLERDKHPGYPFWIAGMEDAVGQRATTPPLDMLTREKAEELAGSDNPLWDHPGLVNSAGGFDGGLPRHSLDGYLAGGHSVNTQNRLDFTKVIEEAKPIYYPEEGTDLEQWVMNFNSIHLHDSCRTLLDGTVQCTGDPGVVGNQASYESNGIKPVASAPFFEPCRDDRGQPFMTGNPGDFWGAVPGEFVTAVPRYGADAPREYRGANIQFDAVLNKAGYHFPQQRIIALWEDARSIIDKQVPPEPLVMRSNTYDCVKYLHTNLVPEYYELDDYQVRTPTDIIGQHIHLPKWDLVSNDGSGNGWNYEDGTLSPGTVRERIEAINAFNAHLAPAEQIKPPGSDIALLTAAIPTGDAGYAIFGTDEDFVGARVTVQRWFTDPVFNTDLVDRGLGIVFTHDHYGPSTHQQVGLYATILAEPAGSEWWHNEEPVKLGTRLDGGPTSWQARVAPGEAVKGDGTTLASFEGFREFYFEFGDFQHAYEVGNYVGAGPDGKPLHDGHGNPTHSPVTAAIGGTPIAPPGKKCDVNGTTAGCGLDIPAHETFQVAINPSWRQQAHNQVNGSPFPDIVRFPHDCPNLAGVGGAQVPGLPRPCPEAISADDVGMLVANYRNEPIGLRVYDPTLPGPDGHLGRQSLGPDQLEGTPDDLAGDLAFALQTRTDRAIDDFNTAQGKPGVVPDGYLNSPLTDGVLKGDPFTPLVRAYPDDLVKIKIQAGSTEHEHNATIHGVKWLQGGSGHGASPTSGWRNAQNDGISEQFTFTAPARVNVGAEDTGFADYAYSVDASQDGWWTGMWGIMRTYDGDPGDLAVIPGNSPGAASIANRRDFDGACPKDAPLEPYTVVAVLANDVLGNAVGTGGQTLVPNDPSATMHVGGAVDPNGGTLVYNNRETDIRSLAVEGPNGVLNIGGQKGALHDPTAMLYVLLEDLEVQPGFENDGACKKAKGKGALDPLLNPQCPVRLKATAPVEPVALRAAAGSCMEVTLHSRIPALAPDLAGYNTLLQMVNRRVDPDLLQGGLLTFNNNLIRPSSYVGLHPQLVEYDVTKHDGTVVGLNNQRFELDAGGNVVLDADGFPQFVDADSPTVVAPVTVDANGAPIPGDPVTYQWYAGDVSAIPGSRKNSIQLVANPVEYGGFNLNPADKIKQGQKGLVGAGVILPVDTTNWTYDTTADHQDDAGGVRTTRAAANVTRSGGSFKDVALVHQKALNFRFGDGTAVPNIASEGNGIPEDSHDAGQMAINYGSEPMWFRFGMPADAPFEKGGLGGVENSHEAFSNYCCTNGGTATTADAGVGDPVTPVVVANAGQEVRIRVLEPTGAGRGTTFNLDGHSWQRDPYIEGVVPSQTIGHNWLGMTLGHQESVTPSAHFDIVLPSAGGAGAVSGDFLFSDQASFGLTSGLWGILRVAPAQ